MNESDLLSSDTTALDAEVPIPNGTAQDFLKAQQYPEVRINQQARASILAWRIQWREEPGRLQFMGHKESDMTEQLTDWLTDWLKSLSRVWLFVTP